MYCCFLLRGVVCTISATWQGEAFMQKIGILLGLWVSAVAYANPYPPSPQGQEGGAGQDRPRHGPPSAFVAACKGKRDGTVVSMRNPQGQVLKGKCQLLWVPDQPPQGMPPQGQGSSPRF